MRECKFKVGDLVVVVKRVSDRTFTHPSVMDEYLFKLCKVSDIHWNNARSCYNLKIESHGWDARESMWSWDEESLARVTDVDKVDDIIMAHRI